MPRCWVAGEASDTLRRLVTAYKDEGRRDLEPTLAGWLRQPVQAAIGHEGLRAAAAGRGVLLVPITGSPRARRRRGDVPLVELVRRSVGELPDRLILAPALTAARSTRDQSALTASERAANVAESMLVGPRWRSSVRGAPCVLVDDLVTTGATLAEGARALHAAGASSVVAVALGAMTRRDRQR